MLLLLSLLHTFCSDWEDISNTQDSISSAIQTRRMLSKIVCCSSYFQLSSQCLGNPTKHRLSCFILYMYDAWYELILHCPHSSFQPSVVNQNLSNYMYMYSSQSWRTQKSPVNHSKLQVITSTCSWCKSATGVAESQLLLVLFDWTTNSFSHLPPRWVLLTLTFY